MPKYVDHAARRREVAEVAAGLVADQGRSALTVRGVAEAAGQSTTVVSHYFADMAELLYETYGLAVRRSRARIDRVLDDDPADIVGLAEALLPLDAERKADWRIWLAFWGEALGSQELATEQRTRARTSADRFHRCLELLAAEGRVAADLDLRATANRLAALILGIAAEAVFDPRKWTAAAQRDAVRAELASVGVHVDSVTLSPRVSRGSAR